MAVIHLSSVRGWCFLFLCFVCAAFSKADASSGLRIRRQAIKPLVPDFMTLPPPPASNGTEIREGALHVPVGDGGLSLFFGKPPTSGGFDNGAGAYVQHGGGGNTWVGASPRNGGTIGIGGSSGGGGFKWGTSYSPSDNRFNGKITIRFGKKR